MPHRCSVYAQFMCPLKYYSRLVKVMNQQFQEILSINLFCKPAHI